MAHIAPSPYAMNLRRLRQSRAIRELTREVRVSVEQLIQPLFVVEEIRARETIPGLTGVYRDTPASLLRQVEADLERGVSKFLLFGVPEARALKDFSFDFVAGADRGAQAALRRGHLSRHRRVPLFLHRARPLRHPQPGGRSRRKRGDRGGTGPRRDRLRAGRRRLRRAERHDGRAGRGDPRRAR